MSILMRGICAIVGHNYRTIKRDNTIWIRKCIDCGKVERILLK